MKDIRLGNLRPTSLTMADLLICANLRVRSDWGLCVAICEQVLATGRTPR